MESIAVIAAVGGEGSACLLTVDEHEAAEWTRAVQGNQWRPLVLVIQERSEPAGQDDFIVRIAPEDVPVLLSQRFPAGVPLHLAVATNPSLSVLLVDQVRALSAPWSLAAPTPDQVPGYREVVKGELHWWIHPDQGHLAPGISAALQPPQTNATSPLRGRVRHMARRVLNALPGPVRANVIRQRHLNSVQANLALFTESAFLDPQASAPPIDWITPEGLPAVPLAGLQLDPLTHTDLEPINAWLAPAHDDDSMLDRRMDNHGDELGRTRRALRTRLAIANSLIDEPNYEITETARGSVLFDSRALQSPAFGTRGIGRFALAALNAVRESVSDEACTLLIDPALEPLPEHIAGSCKQVAGVYANTVDKYSLLIQPSPMTASPLPLIPLLAARVPVLAIVFDFIPAHHPSIYLRHPAAMAEYAAGLDALAQYSDFICISHLVRDELTAFLNRRGRTATSYRTSVAWPAQTAHGPLTAQQTSNRMGGPIVIMTGDDARKNTFVGLAAVGAATSGQREPRNVAVLGMAGHDTRVHHWSIAAAMRPGEARALGRISDEEMAQLLQTASAVVVPSFDEGLSLPVIEALAHGAPVVASDIPAHRELIGAGSFLAPAGDIPALCDAIRATQGRPDIARSQAEHLARHDHDDLEVAVSAFLATHKKAIDSSRNYSPSYATEQEPTLRIAVVTPWPPQATGIADYSAATIGALKQLCDVTVFTSSSAAPHQPLDSLPEHLDEFDAVIYVMGNSHFHLTIEEALAVHHQISATPALVLAHDTRMVEFYASLRSIGGAAQVMTRAQTNKTIDPPLEQQIDDMRLLQNAGLWELAHLGDALLTHSPTSAERITEETSVAPIVLPFAHYRQPHFASASAHLRKHSRESLDISPNVYAIATFGYVDVRTKLTDVVVEAAAWLSQWGHEIGLYIIGSAHPDQARSLTKRAEQAGITDFRITGYVSEEEYQRYLLGIDLGVQLRISPLLGVSGPLADMAAFGTPALASRGVARDVGTPPFITTLPDEVSPLTLAEAIEHHMGKSIRPDQIELERLAYLSNMSPDRYAEHLLAVVRGTVDRLNS